VSADATTSLVKTQIAPSSPTGTVDVKIINTAGSYTKSGFIITSTGSTPTITSISPVFSKSGETVTIYGTNLSGCSISFGTNYPGTGSDVTTVDDTELTITVPAGLVNSGQNKLLNVYATGENGTYKYTPFEVYSSVESYPSILSFTPISGATGTLVSISGSSFAKYFTDVSIYIGGSYYIFDSQTFVSDTEMRGYIPNTFSKYGVATIKIQTPIGTDQQAVFTITA